MAAIPINLQIEKGTDFFAIFTLRDEYGEFINLNAHNVAAAFSNSYISSNKQNFIINVIDAAQGTIEIKLTALQTSVLKLQRYVYDIVVTSPVNLGGKKTRVVQGVIEVSPGVTT
jgi:hypothetical protein